MQRCRDTTQFGALRKGRGRMGGVGTWRTSTEAGEGWIEAGSSGRGAPSPSPQMYTVPSGRGYTSGAECRPASHHQIVLGLEHEASPARLPPRLLWEIRCNLDTATPEIAPE